MAPPAPWSRCFFKFTDPFLPTVIIPIQKIAPPLRSARTLLLWLVLACWLPAVLGTTALFFHMYRDGRAQLEKTTIATARALTQVVDAELIHAQTVALALSTSSLLPRHEFAAFHRRASALLQTVGAGMNVVLSDESGQQIVNTLRPFGEPLPLHGNLAQVRRVFASGKPEISDIFIGQVTGRPVIAVYVPVLSDGRVVYVLGIGIAAQQFNQILRKQRLPPDWITTVFDRNGTIAGRTHDADKFLGQRGSPKIIRRMLAEPEGALEALSREGVPVIAHYSRSPLSSWSVVIGIARQSLEAQLMRTVYLFALGMLILFSVSIGLAWFVGGRISRSVQALTAPAIALEAGQAMTVSQVYFREADDVAHAMARTAQLLLTRTQALHNSHEKLERSEGALLRSRKRLRKLAEHQELIKEDERKRIARDIHDDLGQNLMVLRIDMSMMAARPNLDAISKKQVALMLKQTDITIKAVKAIMNDLRPSVLSLGLHAAIEWLAKEFERRSGIACAYCHDNAESVIDDKHATALFRIVQESLTNIVRHAKASRVEITIRRLGDQLFVTVSDDGIGLTTDCTRKENSLGLLGIEERINALGGTFFIANNPDRGMVISVSIPLADAPAAASAPASEASLQGIV
jgi:signal transduction histidine kinase